MPHCSIEGCLWLAWSVDSGEAVEGGGGIPNSQWGSGGVGRYADTGDWEDLLDSPAFLPFSPLVFERKLPPAQTNTSHRHTNDVIYHEAYQRLPMLPPTGFFSLTFTGSMLCFPPPANLASISAFFFWINSA